MRIAVTGAGGLLGGQVVELLAAEGHHVVRVSRRDLPGGAPKVDTAIADYDDLPSLRAAFRDVETLVLVSSDGEAARVLRHHENLVRAAVDAGVAHVAALSGLDADLTSPFCYAFTNGHTERLLRDSGCAFSLVRASLFTEFFLRWLVAARAGGELRVPAAGGRVSLVSRADVGRCLAALAVAAPTGRHHDVTGPESLDMTALAALAEDEWRTPVRYVDLTPADHRVEMARSGLEPWWLYAFSTMFDSVREQRWAPVSDEVALLTGRRPTSVREVLARHRDAT